MARFLSTERAKKLRGGEALSSASTVPAAGFTSHHAQQQQSRAMGMPAVSPAAPFPASTAVRQSLSSSLGKQRGGSSIAMELQYNPAPPGFLDLLIQCGQGGAVGAAELETILCVFAPASVDGLTAGKRRRYAASEVALMDLDQDGALNRDEFARYYYERLCFEVVSDDIADCRDLLRVFCQYACVGDISDSLSMNAWMRMCNDCKLLGGRAGGGGSPELVFTKARQAGGEAAKRKANKLTYGQFPRATRRPLAQALMLVATKRDVGLGSIVAEVLRGAAVAASGGAEPLSRLVMASMHPPDRKAPGAPATGAPRSAGTRRAAGADGTGGADPFPLRHVSRRGWMQLCRAAGLTGDTLSEADAAAIFQKVHPHHQVHPRGDWGSSARAAQVALSPAQLADCLKQVARKQRLTLAQVCERVLEACALADERRYFDNTSQPHSTAGGHVRRNLGRSLDEEGGAPSQSAAAAAANAASPGSSPTRSAPEQAAPSPKATRDATQAITAAAAEGTGVSATALRRVGELKAVFESARLEMEAACVRAAELEARLAVLTAEGEEMGEEDVDKGEAGDAVQPAAALPEACGSWQPAAAAEEEAAAVRIQAVARGRAARRGLAVPGAGDPNKPVAEAEPAVEAGEKGLEQGAEGRLAWWTMTPDEAATRIQAAVRGRQVRAARSRGGAGGAEEEEGEEEQGGAEEGEGTAEKWGGREDTSGDEKEKVEEEWGEEEGKGDAADGVEAQLAVELEVGLQLGLSSPREEDHVKAGPAP
eukprot:jgi/Tetstr1/464892/TSEL_009629.t1